MTASATPDGKTLLRRALSGHVEVVGAARVAICTATAIDVVAWTEIVLVRSNRNHTSVITDRAMFVVRRPLRSIVATLGALGLMQIHRQVAVNAERVCRLVRRGGHRLIVVLDDRPPLEVGRQYQRAVLDRFGGTAID